MDWLSLVSSKGSRIALIASGVLLMVIGLVLSRTQQNVDQVVLLEASPSQQEASASEKMIIVDVAGSVVDPGVYELPLGVRVEDALVKAGGFSDDADTAYVTKFINRAQALVDGSKVYIPAIGDMQVSPPAIIATSPDQGRVIGVTTTNTSTVSVNSASQSELESLWGIGAARASEIIANRPYANLQELKSKANIPQNVLDRNASIIVF